MVSVSCFLLSVFAKGVRFGTDANSCLRRYQILSIIYFNLYICSSLFLYEVVTCFLVGFKNFTFTVISFTFSPLVFFLIKKGKNNASVAIIMFQLHLLNFSATFVTGRPTIAIIALLVFPNSIFLLASSLRLRIINTLVCVAQYFYHVSHVFKIFKVTLDDEQTIEVFTGLIAAFLVLFFLCVQCLIQKSIETSLWEVAQKNYEKSEDLTKEAVQAVEAKDMFISSLSHEIRNPLNSMTGSIDYLLSVAKDLSVLKVLRNAKLSSEILLNLINNLLDAAKLKSDKMEVSSVETNFDEIIQKVFTINSENLIAKDIFAQAFIDKRLPQQLWTDPSRLLQIMMNLMSNALKFTKQGGEIKIYVKWCSQNTSKENLLMEMNGAFLELGHRRNQSHQIRYQREDSSFDETSIFLDELTVNDFIIKGRNFTAFKKFRVRNPQSIHISQKNSEEFDSIPEPWIIQRVRANSLDFDEEKNGNSQSRGFLKVEVLDTGCGISQEEVPKLFGMFSQGRNRSLTTIQTGTGLGLWICKQLSGKMGGDITVHSQVDKGTKFVFYVPINNSHLFLPPDLIRKCPLKDAVRALVVDDFAFNRDLHKLLLQQEGVHVTLAQNGKEALEKYKAQGDEYFDFILMDVQMPVMDGFTSAKEMRSWEAKNGKRNVDIYFVSGEYFSEEDVLAGFKTQEKGTEAVGLRYLRKPVDIKMLKNIVQKYKK